MTDFKFGDVVKPSGGYIGRGSDLRSQIISHRRMFITGKNGSKFDMIWLYYDDDDYIVEPDRVITYSSEDLELADA